ncbi:hypothetical protein [Lacticaseibacillus manihotivorans]|jgi:hypothetical protein|uniref:Uncharacterized protein n=2 Tax=Lacticaseibacillus manihotivorans TaxID=88233 RepID=A0A0R1QY02_9LACO|nr:hypothetical protein [Lacticaseibacillus manihotivorans]KRL49407.1 hypothetical protein FD01_GL000078 [Lacticaseibacillus manihotivorans DSM 13343 = JCM 12514]QFQ92513.1 hypothetical protein LM010_14455 [Lacticaseibacillus manihotivorans]
MAEENQVFDLIQEITLNDGTRYYELGNILMNGRAEKAVMKHLIKYVRIMQLNIPHSTAVRKYESYINDHYTMPPFDLDHWEQWDKPAGPVKDAYDEILRQNHIG